MKLLILYLTCSGWKQKSENNHGSDVNKKSIINFTIEINKLVDYTNSQQIYRENKTLYMFQKVLTNDDMVIWISGVIKIQSK